MADVLSRRKRRRHSATGMLDAALDYAALGWPVCRGVEPGGEGERACACDRMGCPDPAAHPQSAVWGLEATTDHEKIALWWAATPGAGIILPTGRVFDVFDVPAGAGVMALARMGRSRVAAGPVSAVGGRYLFYVATRGAPADEDEWWSCHLDCVPETSIETPGLRWHCRNSYVLAPPSRLPSGATATWIRPPRNGSAPVELPDPIVALDILADACEEFGR
ncbi:bifunctional DNA primase/polymerase-like protein [Murinocardiopsis flavida]|uniref:Bifunctional DNA primase/polymerase-like protein n=1 Tax=Murinocardiopsis flavida TaxID=645275 RepID=A0A2P8DQW5_9ACTN|nr:bifunctional DNA primase/polymerase [Murinocardiopsis flavida]PSK99600.1 bifunctional DNA primase/polymerase-like protein [Murinocardiopsis flavida]